LDVRLAMLGLALVALAVAAAPAVPPSAGPGPFPSETTPSPPTSPKPAADRLVEKEPLEVTIRQAALIENPLEEGVRGYVYMAIPINSSHQEAYLSEAPPGTSIQVDDEGNPFLVIEVELGPSERSWVNVTVRVRLRPYRVDWIASERRWPPLNVTNLYTGRTTYWDTANETLRDLAGEIASGEDDPYLIVRSLSSWISGHLDYHVRFDRLGSDRAVKLGRAGPYVYGDCTEVADVFVTLARILGVPSRTSYGMMRLRPSATYWANFTSLDYREWTGHVWPQVYIHPIGWVDVEMLEGGAPRVGDYSWRHVAYGIEARKFMGSDFLGAFCRTSFGSEPLYLEVTISEG